MRTQRSVRLLTHLIKIVSILIMCSTMLLMSACGGNLAAQQQALRSEGQLEGLIRHARDIGVPAKQLQPIVRQEQQLSHTNAPLSLFTEQSATEYYQNVTNRTNQLLVQLQGVINASTEATQNQAQQDLKNLQTTLAQRQAQGFHVQNFSQQFSDAQALLRTAQYPKDYMAISKKAQSAQLSLDLLLDASKRLKNFKDAVDAMQQGHLDVTVMQMQYQQDQQVFESASQPLDLQKLNTLLDGQYQQAETHSLQALPYLIAAKLNDFQQQVQQLQTFGVDATAYQKKIDADRATMKQGLNIEEYRPFSQQVDKDMTSIHFDYVKGQANYLVKQFHQEVDHWGQAHLFHDNYDGQTYTLVAGYGQDGIGSDLDSQLSQATSANDFQGVVDAVNDALFNLHMLEADYGDKTSYDKVHETDTQLLKHYNLQKGQVIVVSLVEQAMRVYQDGKIVHTTQVTTGRPQLPSPPGLWSVLSRQSPTVFKSPDPKGSPYWYPDTPIHYAILYHQGGYFIHDSWWRADYGPGTQFPHYDSGGDESFAGAGSHGCINLPVDQANWVYDNTNWQTQILIY